MMIGNLKNRLSAWVIRSKNMESKLCNLPQMYISVYLEVILFRSDEVT